MKLFVTGGTGFLGQSVVAACLAAGHEVRAMVRNNRPALPQGTEPIHVGFKDAAQLKDAIQGCDAIVHMAGKVSRDPQDAGSMHWIHVEATQALLRAATEARVRRFILASTSGTIAVRRDPGPPATEAHSAALEVIGRWPYYMSKRLQEEEVLRWDRDDRIEAVVLNPSLLLGPGDDRLSSTEDVLHVLHGRFPAVTEGTMALVDVRDAAPIFERALTRGRRGTRYLLNGANMSVRSFFERVANTGGVNAPKFKLPKKWAMTGAAVMDGLYRAAGFESPIHPVSIDMGNHHWGCSAQRATEELGFVARDPQSTIADTIAFIEKRGLFRRP